MQLGTFSGALGAALARGATWSQRAHRTQRATIECAAELDVVFRFANNPAVTGRAAVEQAVTGFFTTISGLTHHLLQTWEEGDTVITQADVTYVRQDGKKTTVPNANILTFHDGLVREWRIYIDIAPVYA